MIRALGGLAVAVLVLAAGPAEAKEPRTQLTGVVNLNTAPAAQLDLLPGVGEKAAKGIIAYRAQAPFKRIEDLVKVKGFGKKRFEKVRPYLVVSGDSTLKVTNGGAQGRSGTQKR